ncbi:CRISPR-associated protein Csx3 [bacterium]|nr:CRISPR-associated protein Csx3 [candidate division CSSED10-310 bacterium]
MGMAVIEWKMRVETAYTFLEFTLGSEPIRPTDLVEFDIPDDILNLRHRGLILSGRGPVWLYAHLVHRAHPFAWVAVFDPRLQGGVVVMNHCPDGPGVGTVIPVNG